MAFLDLLIVACMPMVKLLLISGLGVFLSTRYMNVLTKDACKYMNKVVFIAFTPALMFSNLAKSVTFQDLISWWYMPVNVFLTCLIGTVLGWIIVKIMKPPKHLNGIIIANCCAGNLGNLLIVFVPAMCGQTGSPFGETGLCKVKGTAYASFSMALGSLFIWTYVYSIVRSASQIHIHEEEEIESEYEKIPSTGYLKAGEGTTLLQKVQIIPEVALNSSVERRSCFDNFLGKAQQYAKEAGLLILEELEAPPTIGVIAGFIVGSIPQVKALFLGESSPLRVINDSISLLAEGAIPSMSLILGGNLIQGVRSSSLKTLIIIAVICVRFVLLPVIGIFVVRGASYIGALPADPLYHFVLMIQFTVPPATNIGTMAQLFNVGEQECAVIFLWTYALAAVAITFWSTVYMWILFP